MNLPQQFIEQIESYGAPCLAGLCEALSSTAPEVSVRVNRRKGVAVPDGADRVAWCPSGFYLDGRRPFTFDPAFHQGLYYVQDASSMAISAVVATLTESRGPQVYLDACAAPGGKTTAAIDSLPDSSLVVANEYDFKRAAILAENIAKWGDPGVVVSRGDTARFRKLRSTFDIIAADVPCSGEGMMRKDPEAVAQWTPSLVHECAARQREIVDNLWPALKPGGFLIYSTCTFNRLENEEMVDYICRELGGETVVTPLDSFDCIARGIDTPHHCYRFIPGRTRGEGLFMAVIRKNGDSADDASAATRPAKNAGKSKDNALEKTAASFLDGDYKITVADDTITALPAALAAKAAPILKALDVVSAGLTVATVKGKDLIPSQSLALSTALCADTFPTVEVDYTTAMTYLRREAVTIDAPRSFVLLSYGGRPLGFVKNLGNRSNNLYPAPWRILSTHLPDTFEPVL